MGLIYAIIGSVLQGFIGWFFPKKSVDEKSDETLIAEKQEIIEKVGKANEIRNRMDNDVGFANSVRSKYERND